MAGFFKRLFCKHEYRIEEYFFGDMKNYEEALEYVQNVEKERC